MLKEDTLHTGQQVRLGLLAGIRKSADAVRATMGTGGNNGLVESMASPGYLLTNDGATILESMRFSSRIEDLGHKILLEAVSRANKASGDGSSTTTVLTHAILEEGEKYLKEKSPMEIKRSLESCIPKIEALIQSQKRDIMLEDVWKVAAISAEDEKIGRKIGDIYEEIGEDGIIHWDISKTGEDYHTIGRGITIDGASIASPYMLDQDKQSGGMSQHAKLVNPLVIVTREKLTNVSIFEKLFSSLNEEGKKEVVIFCEDYEIPPIAHLVMTHQRQGFRTVVVKLPVVFGDEWAEDIARASGATVIDPASGLALKDIHKEHLGCVSNVTVTRSDTYLDGILDLSEHIETLKNEGSDKSLMRASRLNTKTARYFVGALSDSALSYRRLKVEDAINAAYHALRGGVVAGGGVALLECAKGLQSDTGTDCGVRILKAALETPFKAIVTNAGIKHDSIAIASLGKHMGVDTRTGEFVNMYDANITDPAAVVLNAAKNAVSVAASVLTAHTVVLLPREGPENHGL